MDMDQDYLMRMIKQMVRAIISVLLGKENSKAELSLDEQYETTEGFYHDLLTMVRDGHINEAENLLSDHIDYSVKQDVSNAILFYGYLNDCSDEFLKQNNYSREEVDQGLRAIAKHLGMSSIADAFTEDDEKQ